MQYDYQFNFNQTFQKNILKADSNNVMFVLSPDTVLPFFLKIYHTDKSSPRKNVYDK